MRPGLRSPTMHAASALTFIILSLSGGMSMLQTPNYSRLKVSCLDAIPDTIPYIIFSLIYKCNHSTVLE